MKTVPAAIFSTVLVAFVLETGFVAWHILKKTETTAQAQQVVKAQTAVIDEQAAAQDAAHRHELLNHRYQMAQIVWSALEAPPERIRFYGSCLEFKERWGEWGHKRCAQLDKQLDRDARELDRQAKEYESWKKKNGVQ